jgi:hypothetical protein
LPSLSFPSHRSEFGFQLADLSVEPADDVRLVRHGLHVAGQIAAGLKVMDVATDPLWQASTFSAVGSHPSPPAAASSLASISRNAWSMNRTTLGMSAWTAELG